MNSLFEVSNRYQECAGDYPVGVVVARTVRKAAAVPQIDVAREVARREIDRDRLRLQERIQLYDNHFSANDVPCPLPKQFERVLAEGFPRLNRFVETMFIVEMSTGILMGAQDFDHMSGTLLFDVADTEGYDGMRGWINCRRGGTVVRDSKGIVASLFEGSDSRTRITSQTTTGIFFAFGIPAIGRSGIEDALDRIVDILGPCSEETLKQVYG